MVPWSSASLGSLMEPFPVPFHAGCPLSGQQFVLKQWQKGWNKCWLFPVSPGHSCQPAGEGGTKGDGSVEVRKKIWHYRVPNPLLPTCGHGRSRGTICEAEGVSPGTLSKPGLFIATLPKILLGKVNFVFCLGQQHGECHGSSVPGAAESREDKYPLSPCISTLTPSQWKETNKE